MKTKTLAIGLAADRIDVLVCHGDRVFASRRFGVALDADPLRWGKTVKDASRAVAAAARELGVGGAPAIVLYRGPTECAEYASLRFRSSAEAQQAAILGCADVLSCPLDLAVCEASVIGRDTLNGQPQTHVVVAADRDESVSAIAAMVNQAGLRFVSATPIDAAIMSRVASAALRSSGPYTGRLYIGEHRSFFVIAGKRSLLFGRAIGLGVDMLITSLTRPVRVSASAEPIELSRDTAQKILHEHGFPDRRQVVHPGLNLVGGHIVPLLQPIIQRFIIELRQSLRFGLPEELRKDFKIEVAGPGSGIPGLIRIIADELDVQTTPDARYSSFKPNQPGSEGSELVDAIGDRKGLARLGLQPQHLGRMRQNARLRKWLWTGAAAAVAVVALDAMHYHKRLTEVRREAEAVAASAADRKMFEDTAQKLMTGIGAMNALEGAVTRETGATLNLRGYLKELSLLTPPSVSLTGVSFNDESGVVTGSLQGYAFDGGPAGRGKTQLEPFMNKLRGSPLFDNVVLAQVQASTLADQTGQRFEANFTAVTTPRTPPSEVVAADRGAAP